MVKKRLREKERVTAFTITCPGCKTEATVKESVDGRTEELIKKLEVRECEICGMEFDLLGNCQVQPL